MPCPAKSTPPDQFQTPPTSTPSTSTASTPIQIHHDHRKSGNGAETHNRPLNPHPRLRQPRARVFPDRQMGPSGGEERGVGVGGWGSLLLNFYPFSLFLSFRVFSLFGKVPSFEWGCFPTQVELRCWLAPRNGF